MSEYIDRDLFLEDMHIFKELEIGDAKIEAGYHACAENVEDALKDFVTADVKPVVYCKDCKHSYDDISGLHCSYGVCVDCVVDEDFYCKNGERDNG